MSWQHHNFDQRDTLFTDLGVFEKFRDIYKKDVDYFVKQQTTLRRGTDQTPLNYVVRMNDVDVKFLPPHYRMSHLPRKDLLAYNWQLNEDRFSCTCTTYGDL